MQTTSLPSCQIYRVVSSYLTECMKQIIWLSGYGITLLRVGTVAQSMLPSGMEGYIVQN